MSPAPTRVLIVTDRIAAAPDLIKEIRDHAANGPLDVRLLVPNPAPAEWHPTHPERRAKADAAEQVLREMLPALREAAGTDVDGFVSTRHDPMDAIEEQLHEQPVDALVLAMPARHLEGWLHADLPHRVRHLGLPVTTVTGTQLLDLGGSPTHPRLGPGLGRRMLNKVPEITLFFWVIKIMCTTVGETAADYLNDNLGFGLTWTTVATGVLLVAVLAGQFRLPKYVPGVYWSAVVVISVFGTLITDNMTDRYNVPLTTSTPIFAVILAIVFAVWWGFERTLSIHTIFTTRREGFYWLAILFTFALGTAAGDLVAEQFSIGYGVSIAIFGAVIALITLAYYAFKLNAVLAFWLAYIMTRPLGASIGDFMSQHSKKYGGLGLGTTGTSYIFLGCILALVVFLSITRRDATEVRNPATS